MPQIKMQAEFYIPNEEFEQGIEKALKNNPNFALVVRCKDCAFWTYEGVGSSTLKRFGSCAK